MNQMKLVFLFIFLILAGVCTGQNADIAAKVINRQTGEPIEGAFISSIGSHKNAVSKSNGSFIISVSEQDTIKIHSLGYQSITLPVSQIQKSGVIPLEETTLDLGSVIVVTAQSDFSDSNSRFHLSGHPTSTDDLMNKLQGVTLTKRGAFAWEPGIRGLTDTRVSVTLDGMKIYGACTDRMDPVTSYIELQNLKSLTVSQDGSASLSGSSTGGAMDFKLAEADLYTPFSASFESGFETGNFLRRTSLVLSSPVGAAAIRVSGSVRKAGDYTSSGNHTVPYSGYQKWNLSFSGAYPIGESGKIRTDYLRDDARNVGYPALTMDVGIATADIASVSWIQTGVTPWFLSSEFRVYANRIIHEMDDTHRKDVFMHMDMPGKTATAGGFWDAGFFLFNNFSGKIRLEGSETRGRAEMTMYGSAGPMFMLTWPDIRRRSGSSAFSIDYPLNQNHDLSAFIRTEWVFQKIMDEEGFSTSRIFNPDAKETNSRFIFSGSVSESWKLTQTITLTNVLTYSERLPSFTEQYGFYLYNRLDGYDYVGSTDISNEKVAKLESRLIWNSDRTKVTFTGFYYQFSDFIIGTVLPGLSTMTYGANGVKRQINRPSAQMGGFEGSLLYRLTKDLRFQTQIQGSWGSLNDGDPIPQLPPVSGSWIFRWEPTDFMIQAEGKWAMEQNRVSKTMQEPRTPGYNVYTLKSGWKRKFDSVTIVADAGIENLMDAKYKDHSDWGQWFRMGRNFVFSVGFGWN